MVELVKGNKSIWILIGLVLLKIVLSIPFITLNPIDLDEPFSIFHSQNSLSGLFQIFQTENNPPAHFILLHFWEQLFGIGPISVRSLSLIFSILTILVLWKIGMKFFNEKSALIVCLLFIFSDFHHYHGIEARTYSLLALEFTILIYLLLSIIINTKSFNLKSAVLLGFINVLLFYTHYIAPLIFLGEIILVLFFIKRLNWKIILLTLVVFCIGIFPWVNVLLGRVNSVKSTGTWLSQAQYTELYGLINKFFNDKWAFFSLVLIVGGIIILKRSKVFSLLKNKWEHILILLTLFFVPYLSAFILSRFGVVEIFYDRYLYFLTIPLYFVVSIFFQPTDKIITYSLSLFIAIYLLRFDFKPNNNRDGNEIAAFVKKSNVESIIIAPDYYDLTFLYHYDQNLFKDISIRQNKEQYGIYAIKNIGTLDSLQFKESVAVVDADFEFVNPGQSVKKWFLDNNYDLKSMTNFKGNYKVYLFDKKESIE